jgi:predicted nucleic acid-binding protein
VAKAKYLVDANVFIQAKNLYYRFDFCEAFWTWLLQAHEAGLVYSIKKVKKELMGGDKSDLVRKWVADLPDDFFLDDVTDQNVMRTYAKLMQWSSANTHFLSQAKAEFAKPDVADAFLIAVAKQHGYEIISQEKSNIASKKKIYLPDAANAFDVDTIFVYDMLSKHSESTFKLKTK